MGGSSDEKPRTYDLYKSTDTEISADLSRSNKTGKLINDLRLPFVSPRLHKKPGMVLTSKERNTGRLPVICTVIKNYNGQLWGHTGVIPPSDCVIGGNFYRAKDNKRQRIA